VGGGGVGGVVDLGFWLFWGVGEERERRGWGEELARCLWFLWMCFWLRWVLGQYPGGSVCDVDFNVAART